MLYRESEFQNQKRAEGEGGFKSVGVLNALFKLSVIFFIVLSGCSSKDSGLGEESDTIEHVCNFGVWNGKSCVNSKVCTRNLDCLEGMTCEAGECTKAGKSCNGDSECGNGRYCGKGKCQALEGCQTRGECEIGEYCLYGFCMKEDRICKDLRCGVAPHTGVCAPESGSCVNATSCLTNGIPDDNKCISTYFCDESGGCTFDYCVGDTSTICKENGGFCDKATGSCVSRKICKQDEDCLKGLFCVRADVKSAGVCKKAEDRCKVLSSNGCPGKRQCVVDGNHVVSCREPAKCVSTLDCDKGRVCYGEHESGYGVCVEASTLSAIKEDSFDSNGNANDSKDAPTVCTSETGTEVLCKEVEGKELTVQGGNEDWYKFSVNADGTLTVMLTVKGRDVGNAEVQVELYDATHPDPVKTATTAEHQASQQGQSQEIVRYKDRAEVKMEIRQAKRGEYYAKVSILGSEVRGVHYSLDINLVGSQVYDDCSNTSLLKKIDFAGKDTITIKSDMMSDRTTSLLSSSCVVDSEGKNTDVVYELDVETDSLIEVKLENDGDEESKNMPGLSIRRVCQSATSEIACSLGDTQDAIIKLTDPLKAGRYYLILTSNDVADPNLPFFNKYRLTITRTPTICSESDNVCKLSDNNTLIKCNDKHTEMVEVTCPKGCDKTKKVCKSSEGDTCPYAIEMTGTHFDKTYQVKDFEDVYQGSACTQLKGKEYNGKDFVVKTAVVPAGQLLWGTVEASGTVAVYVTEECTDSKVKKCTMGKDLSKVNSNQTFNIFNNSGEDKVYYLIFDYEMKESPNMNPTNYHVILDIKKAICNPGKAECLKGETESWVCNDEGTNYLKPKKCDCGCDTSTGKCMPLPNDTCHTGAAPKCPLKPATASDETILLDSTNKQGAAINEQVVKFGRIEDVNDSIENYTCINNMQRGGRDYVYKIIPPVGQAVTYSFELNSYGMDTFNAIMWYSDSCDDTTVGKERLTKCNAGVDNEIGKKPEKLTYHYEAQSNPKPFWLVIEPYSSEIEHGSFLLKAKVIRSEGAPLTYGKCVAANGQEPAYLPYYDEFGIPIKDECDVNGCSTDGDHCANPSGRTCQQAKKLYPTTDQNGHVVGSGSETIQLDLLKCQTSKDKSCSKLYPKPLPMGFARTVGDCIFGGGNYPEKGSVFYSFELNAGETLSIDYNDHKGSNAYAFFMKKCNSVDTCEGGIIPLGSNKLTYRAKINETIFFVIKLVNKKINTNSKKMDFKWKIENNIKSCQPDTFFCETENNIAYCNNDGQVETVVACPMYPSGKLIGGCKYGNCLISPKAGNQSGIGDTCSNPIDLGEVSNIGFTVERLNFSNSVMTSCVSSSGEDTVFKFFVPKDKLLKIGASQIDPKNEPKVYLLDAKKNSSCSVSTELKCIEYLEPTSITHYPDAFYKNYYVREDSEYYLVIDYPSESMSTKSLASFLSINVINVPDECKGDNRNSVVRCSNDKEPGIDLCYNGQIVKFVCTDPCKESNAPPNCDSSDLTCDTSMGFASCNSSTLGSAAKSGQYCFDAIPFEPKNGLKSQVFHGVRGAHESNISSPVIEDNLLDGCIFDDMNINDYGEEYYSVYLKKGEKLSAKLKSKSNYSRLYIMTGCYSKDATCESVRLDNYSSKNRELKYEAQKDGYVYVIHDVTASVNSFKYDLTITKYNADEDVPCIPFDSYCDENGNVVQCTSDGKVVRRQCRFGKEMCKSGSCIGEENERNKCSDIASGAPDIEVPQNLSISSDNVQIYSSVLRFSQMTNNLDMPDACGDSFISDTAGNDAFFKVQVPPGGTIRTYLAAPVIIDGRILVYYLKENGCDDPNNACQKIEMKTTKTQRDEFYQTEYKNETATQQNIIVGIDSYKGYSASHNYSRKIYIEVDLPNCDPNTYVKKCSSDKSDLIYCSFYGYTEAKSCPGGCQEVTSGDDKCSSNPEGNICSDAFQPEFDSNNEYKSPESGTPHTLNNATDVVHLKNGNNCPASGNQTMFHPQTGRDRIYEVELDPNQTLTATVKSLEDPTEDLSIYVVDDCEKAKDHCLIGSDLVPEGEKTPETLVYTNTATKKKAVFVVVDSPKGVGSNGNPIKGKYQVTMRKETLATP